ncbi:hypothetical protein B0A55_13500 [Friedmanniomyces simplex]|uniref:Uncharacterized protein n=1 Tax=Friedmanniomyces simplex TaxID=329884 RepID=A0A4U0WQK5_9PEZI|nr:hypothetical protein B0A55_13500 [Friedmanniomyces simplex]
MEQTAALEWTDRLRKQLHEVRASDRNIILEREARGLVLNADIAALCAELIWSEHSDTWNHSPAWAQIRDLAGRAERVKRTDQLRDPKHFRALLYLTKTWGLDKVERYQWRTAGRPLVEELRRLAERCPECTSLDYTIEQYFLRLHKPQQ